MENYEVVNRLGSGGCGAVFLVRHKTSRKLYALKKIELDERKKYRTKDAVQKEASILAQLKHTHIVSYHESFFDEDEEYLCIIQAGLSEQTYVITSDSNADDVDVPLAMVHDAFLDLDYCDGGTLDDKIREARMKGKYFEEDQIMQWFVQIIMAVQYIHSKKVLHRDLKTENVFLTKKNVVKIGDFGISKMLENTIDLAKTVVGTPSYLSPELCEDIPYSSKSDIWAVGCLLYEMCALKPPFDAQSLISLFFKIIKGEFENIPSHYSKGLQGLVASILVKTPDDRPSASAILNEPHVKTHLSKFIAENEILLFQKSCKEDPNRSSPNIPSLKLKAAKGLNDLGSKPVSPQVPKKQKASPEQQDSGLSINTSNDSRSAEKEGNSDEQLSDYSDDFDESSENDIPEELGNDEREVQDEYADDFEEYDSSEDLDELVTHAKEAQEIVVEDNYFADDKCYELHLNQTVIFRETCGRYLRDNHLSSVSKMIEEGTLREEDLKSELRRSIGDDNIEICHLDISDL